MWQYNSGGELTNAVRKWSDGSLVAGQQFEYVFDTIGNRRSSGRDGRGQPTNKFYPFSFWDRATS